MEQFFKAVEKKAFRMIQIATGDADDALDLLQDSMMKFVRSYGDKPQGEWKPLFYRVVQNNIRDWYRKEKVKQTVFGWLPGFGNKDEQKEIDPMQAVADKSDTGALNRLKALQAMEKLEEALKKLPQRQQQVFLLRAWEGLSISETANAMNCTDGTVKTHYSRALNSLKRELEGVWP